MKTTSLILVLLVACATVAIADGSAVQPVTPAPSDEATTVAEAPIEMPVIDSELGRLFQDPEAMIGCPPGTCDDTLDCWDEGYYCPLGEVRTCFGSTGNCDGNCGCS